MKRLAVLTSGGDAPGMNACIRAIVRAGLQKGLEIMGFVRGYQGVVAGDFRLLDSRSVSNILQRGGTILHTARCPDFQTEEGLQRGAKTLSQVQVDALLVIGGDGSFRGAHELSRFWKGQIIGLPGTIDNDLYGTDFTIGFDTAVMTALESIDKIRDTADAHERFFLVEVMGRHSGFIALEVGVTGGAEEILVPEVPVDLPAICERLCAGKRRGKASSIIVVAEGAYEGGAYAVAEELRKLSGCDYRVCVLGHIQRGGSPSANDRLLASKLGVYAVDEALRGATGVMAGQINAELLLTPLPDTWGKRKAVDASLARIARILAT
ncbi:MAG: 6-phosphofructokinase [bacterium]